MENKRIVKVNIRDNDLFYDRDFPDGVLREYYLINPDEEKLNELKVLIETRFDSDNEDLADDVWGVIEDFVNKNFMVLNITEEFEIAY